MVRWARARLLTALACVAVSLCLAPASASALVTDDTSLANYTITGTSGDDTITISDGAAGHIRVTVGASDPIDFANKTNVTVDGGGGNDTFVVSNTQTATGLQRMTLTGGSAVQLGSANYTGATLFIDTTGAITDTNANADNVTATSLGIRTSGAVASVLDPLEVSVSNLEITSGADQYVLARSAVRVGGVAGDNPTTTATTEPELTGLTAHGTGDIGLLAQGITLNDTDGAVMVQADGGGVGLVSAGAGNDLVATANKPAVATPSGEIVMSSDGDIDLGTAGGNFDNNVLASGEVNIQADGDVTVDGGTSVTSDAFAADTGSPLSIDAGRDVNVTADHGNQANVAAGGSAGASVTLTAGADGTVRIARPASSAVFSLSGDVTVKAGRVAIDPASGITAGGGTVTIEPATPGRKVDLGSTTDSVPGTLELSDAEADRLFASVVRIGGTQSDRLTVSAPINSGSTGTLDLVSGNGFAATGAGSVTENDLGFRDETPAGRVWRVTPTTVQGVPYSTGNLRLDGGSARDLFEVKASATAPYTIDANDPAGGAGDALHYDTEGRTTSGDSTPPDGAISSPGRQDVTFKDVEHVFVAEDFDGDGLVDGGDNCPSATNPHQADLDGDGQGDACDADDDGDGLSDADEPPAGTNPRVADSDRDGTKDGPDNCPALANRDQANTDGAPDGGDACDADDDNDGVDDGADNCPLARNHGQADADGDGIGNACDKPVSARLVVAHHRVKLDHGKVRLQLRCGGDAGVGCRGTLRLRSTNFDNRLEAAGVGPRLRFDIPAGGRQVVRAAVPEASRRRLASKHKAVAYVLVRMHKPLGGITREKIAITLIKPR
jgi:hypothetical protein